LQQYKALCFHFSGLQFFVLFGFGNVHCPIKTATV